MTQLPSFADDQALSAALAKGNVTINAKPPSSGPGLLSSLLVGFGPTLLLIAAFIWLWRRAATTMSAGPLSTFSRSRARRVESRATASFADVAGIDEAKDELAEIVDYLRRPERYRRLGGRIPSGVLLAGAPGTGKTLLARAVAGEAKVPFFSMSASEFVEMIVGVGASRCATCSYRRRRRPPRSSSSTSSMPSGGCARPAASPAETTSASRR